MGNYNKQLLLICGNSGGGKSYLTNKLVEFYPSIFYKLEQYTTREPRPNENEYYYVTKDHFNIISDCLIAKTYVNGNYYGTVPAFQTNGKIAIIIVNAMGLKNTLSYLNENTNINYKILYIKNDEPFEERPDKRDIEKETNDLENMLIFEAGIKDTNFLYVKNSINDPVTITDLFEIVYNAFISTDHNLLKNTNLSLLKVIKCPWVTCIYNDGVNCNNPGPIEFSDHSLVECDGECEKESNEYFLYCDSYKFDHKFYNKK